MTPEEQMQFVENQVEFCQQTDCEMIRCPYCGYRNVMSESQTMCCELLAKAIDAVLDRQETKRKTQNTLAIVERVMNNLAQQEEATRKLLIQ